MSSDPQMAFGLALLALIGVLITGFIAILNARKRGELDGRLLEMKANLDKLNALEIASVQAEHSVRLKNFEQDRASNIAAGDRRRLADTATLKNILEILDAGTTVAFLRNHDFGGLYDRERTEPLFRYLELSRRPDADFLNENLEQLRQSLTLVGGRLIHLLAIKTHPRQGTFSSAVPESMINEEIPTWIDENVKEINDAATEFVEVFEKLVRRARLEHGG